ncbi:MAG: hypothetical protein ACOYL6_00140 [Bacteriovoracaceae bacterium]
MLKKISLLFLIIFSFSGICNDTLLLDPALSRRCRELLIDRNDKVALKRKIVTLIKRNEDILKHAAKNKELGISRLKRTLSVLGQERIVTELKIGSMEENIVKQGCPGISLSE